MPIDIAYIASHGFASRMITQTNLLGKLVSRGKKIALIVPDKNDKHIKNYCDSVGVKCYQFSPKSSFWSSNYINSRKYYFEDLKNNTALWEKHIKATRYNKSKNPMAFIRPRFLYFIHSLIKLLPNLRNWFEKRESSNLESKAAEHLIEEIAPKVLISTYPVNFNEATLLNAAKKSKIKTVTHLLSWDNISCKGRFPVLTDEFIAWGPIMNDELIEYYNIDQKKIYPCGVPHFDLHVSNRDNPNSGDHVEKLGIDRNKPYIFFGMSSPRFAPKEIDIIEKLVEKVESNQYGEDVQLIVRPHPQNVQGGMADLSWLPRLKKIYKGKVAIDFPDLVKDSSIPWSMQKEDMERLSSIIAGSLICLNSGSTLSIDSLMCNVPVIITSFDGSSTLDYWESARRLIDYPHLKKLVDLRGVSVVKNYDELDVALKSYINEKDFNLDNRKLTVDQYCTTSDISATDKVVETLINMDTEFERFN